MKSNPTSLITRRRVNKTLTGGLGLAALPLTGCAKSAENANDTSEKGNAMSASEAGFEMPPEEAPHERTFMQWPVEMSIYGGRRWLEETQNAIAALANAISEFEPVVMLSARNAGAEKHKFLSAGVTHWDIPTEDLWARDSGPAFVTSATGELAVVDFNFNGWGGKQRHRHDGAVARAVAERMGVRYFDSGVVGEPGGLETDGAGTIIAHESSWVNTNRNTLTRGEISDKILAALGAKKMIWAPGLKDEDITDYHIDALARFTAPGKILMQLPEGDPQDPFIDAASKTHAILREAVDATGARFEITLLPDPVNIRARDDDFVASYVNYYVCNDAVIAAQFGDAKTDAAAKEMLQAAHPGREIVMLNVDPIGAAGGGIHCATQQQPKV